MDSGANLGKILGGGQETSISNDLFFNSLYFTHLFLMRGCVSEVATWCLFKHNERSSSNIIFVFSRSKKKELKLLGGRRPPNNFIGGAKSVLPPQSRRRCKWTIWNKNSRVVKVVITHS